VLEIKNIRVSYDKAVALRNVSMEVRSGELVACWARTGRQINLVEDDFRDQSSHTGSISWQGEPPSTRCHRTVLSNRALSRFLKGVPYFELSVQENLRMGAFYPHRCQAVAEDWSLSKLFPRLRERQKQSAGTLSGGEAQMVAIARGLLSKPRLLMLDEPSLGLAPVVRELIFDVINQIYKNQHITILLVEQNARWALQVATRGYILENGRISLEGTGAELNSNPHVQKSYRGIRSNIAPEWI
jgi:branched-chain amino acid transport system ATP-binding protein